MLSKKEREYLSGELKLSKNYQRKIEHSIRKKLGVFRELELPLLRRSEVIGGEASYLGKLTSCQSGLTPLNLGFVKYLLLPLSYHKLIYQLRNFYNFFLSSSVLLVKSNLDFPFGVCFLTSNEKNSRYHISVHQLSLYF